MPIDLIRGHVTRMPDGDWSFGYLEKGTGPVGKVGSYNLSAEVVCRIYEQTVGQPPLTGLGEQDINDAWDRVELVVAVEIERRIRG